MRILIISKHFPPRQGAHPIQTAKIANALVDYGHEIEVVTALLDGESEPECRFPVHYFKINKFDGRTSLPSVFPTTMNKMFRALQNTRWNRKTFHGCLRIAEAFRPDIVLSSSSPFHSHHVGLLLHRAMQIPWVACFSDPWPPRILPKPYGRVPDPITNWWYDWLIRNVLGKSSAIVMTNSHAISHVQNRLGIIIADRSVSIPHIGSEIRVSVNYEKRILAHIGALTPVRNCPELLEAFKTVATERPHDIDGLLFVGDVCDEFKQKAAELDLTNLIEFRDYVPHEEAIKIAGQCAALLVVEADMTESPFLPSKFADYALAGRPILAITPPMSPMRDYLSKYGGGKAVSRDASEIALALREIFRGAPDADLGPEAGHSPLASNFKSEMIARRFTRVFQEVLSSKTRARKV